MSKNINNKNNGNNKNRKYVQSNNSSAEEEVEEKYSIEYGYDFIPTLHHWTNVDEQKIEAVSLENISKKEE